MKLATLKDGTRDGHLIVVSRDLADYVDAKDVAPNLQSALDNWKAVEPKLLSLAKDLESGKLKSQKLDTKKLAAPLPRAFEWVDGSAYINHIVLVRKARGAEPPETLRTDPLVYQGGSGIMLGCNDNIYLADESWGCDFESEITIVLDDIPQGTKKADVHKYVRLVMLANDVSLRNLIPVELQKGFGFFNSKPATAFSPVAVTPDELGDAWKDGRLHLPLITNYNGEKFGDPDAGPEMHFSFFEIVEHICKTRAFTAGTIVGSGTISNEDRSRGSSCLAEKRMIEKIDNGVITTPFMKPGDTVDIEVFAKDGASIFGRISQEVTS
jgi:fumarylacetoacetate (FAA) hydrolase